MPTKLTFTLIFMRCCIIAVYSQEDLLTILQKSKQAVELRDLDKNMEVLQEHYFTTEKVKSIWNQAFLESYELLGIKWGFDDVQFLQYLIQRSATHFKSCRKIDACKPRAHCFSQMAPVLHDLEKGALWELNDSEISKDERYDRGFLYISVVAFVSHISVVSADSFKCLNNGEIPKDKVKPFVKTIQKQQNMLHDYVVGVIDRRLDKITPVKICDMNSRLWKAFEQTCETRWHSLDGENKIQMRSIVAINEYNNVQTGVNSTLSPSGQESNTAMIAGQSEMGKSEDENEKPIETNITFSKSFSQSGVRSSNNSVEDLLKIEDENRLLVAVDKIGRITNIDKIRYRAQVHDDARKELLFEAYIDADPTSKSEAMDFLAARALNSRSKTEERVRTEVTDFIGEIFAKSHDIMAQTILQIFPH